MYEQVAELDEVSPGPSCRRSPGPAEQASSSWLQRTRQSVQQSPSLSLVSRARQPLCVLAVQRYLGESGRWRYAYDVTLYDGVLHDTWLLSPELSHLVHRKLLGCGSRAAISRCSYRYAEKKLCGGVVCIEELQVGEDMDEEERPACEAMMLPLCGGRKHYLPLWNNDDPYGEMWAGQKEAASGSVDVSKICSLQKLEMKWSSKMQLPPLLVRIMHKSRLRYFGKTDQKIEYPYQAYFEVADHSGMMSMVMWNYLCLEWYNTLQIGNVVFLHQYTLKKSYPNRTLPTTGNTQVKRLPNLEISLNVRDPVSKISVLQKEDVKPEWRLPDVKYQFITRSELNNLPHNQVCDVIGLVTYVGRCERKRIKDGEDFWLYRWVHVVDGTSDQPLLLEIYATSQPHIFENIHPLTYLVCTQMRVVNEHPEDEFCQAYLTTSNESQVFITKCHKGQPYKRDEKVKDFINWMKTQHEKDFKRNTTISIGGFNPYPQAPATFAKYCSDKVEKMLSTINELKVLIDQLHYREHRRVAIQGIIAACRFVEKDELQVSEVKSHKESVSLAHHRNTELDSVKSSPSDSHNKHQRNVITSHSNAKEVVDHCETTNVDIAKRRKKHAEDVSVIGSERSHIMPFSTHDVDANIQEFLTSEDEETNSSIVESEESDRTLSCGRSWENALWSEVKHQLMDHLHYSTVFPESLPRKFDYRQKEFLMQQYNLHPSKLVKSMCTSKLKIQNFDSASGPGHYEVTILGINRDLAIDVSLPVLKNFRLFGPNYLPNQIQCLDPDWNAEILAHHWLSLKDELMKYSSALDRLHTICVLDICHLGERKVEIILNRVYNPIREGS